jgi:hypothetical protein
LSRIFLFLFFCPLIIMAQSADKDSAEWVYHITHDSFKVMYKYKAIPQRIRDSIFYDAEVSDAGGKFNSGCVGEGPRKRIIFVANSNEYWLISYEQGGRAHNRRVLLIKAGDNNSVKKPVTTMYLSEKIHSLADLKAYVEKNGLRYLSD